MITPYATLVQHIGQTSFAMRNPAGQGVLTPERYAWLRLGVGATSCVALGLGWWTQRVWQEGEVWRVGEAQRCWRALGRPWQALGNGQRGVAIGMAMAVAGARLWYGIGCPLVPDELFSYDYCVLPGAAVTASYYPYPNNHLLANLLVGLVHWGLPEASSLVALRLLPTLAGLLALPLVYLLLLRHARMEVVTLGVGLWGLSPDPVFFAVVGRGYAWAMVAALVGLCATLELLRPAAGQGSVTHRLAWAVFGGSAVMGLYAVPTHLYTVLAFGLLLGLGLPVGRQRATHLAHLTLTAAGVGVVTTVLYVPIGAVSGWPALFSNTYITPIGWADYWAQLGFYLVETTTTLLGQRGWSALAFGGLIVVVPLVLAEATRLPASTRRLGWVLYGQLVLWLPVAMLHQVLPPPRTLLFVLLAFMLLLGLLGQVLVIYCPGRRWRAMGWVGVGLVLALYGGYRLPRQWAIFALRRQQVAAFDSAYRWVRQQHLQRIWVDSDDLFLLWHHYALLDGRAPLPLFVKGYTPATSPAVSEVAVLTTFPPVPSFGQPPLFQNNYLLIVPVPMQRQAPTPALAK
jgi:hypothetical protein